MQQRCNNDSFEYFATELQKEAIASPMVKRKNIFLLLFLALAACGDSDVDRTPPSINVTNFIPTPVADEICGGQEPTVFLLSGGEELSFTAIFEDDVALSQYKVDVHNNFDCHGHGGGVAPSVVIPSVSNQTTDWSITEVQNLEGTSVTETRTFIVPENVTAGNYHYHIQVLDAVGNDSPFTNFYSLKVKNPLDDVPPQINVQQPSVTNLSITNGAIIRFQGQVTDNRSLSDGGNGVLYLAYTDLSSGNTFTTDHIFPFDTSVDQAYDFDFEYVVPATLVAGDYRFSLGANDGVRNVASFVFFDAEIN